MNSSMKRFLFLLLLVFLICSIGCNNNTEKIPWSMEKTLDVLTEVQLIEAKLNTMNNTTIKDSLSNRYYQELFTKFDTNQEELSEVFNYYANNPQKMEEIYSEIITRLSLIQSQEKETIKD